jgi:prevent-host-death family protein
MKNEISAAAFKATCLAVLDDVQRERKAVVITKRGKPVAKLVPVDSEKLVIFGRLKGSGEILGDIFSTGEIWEADA